MDGKLGRVKEVLAQVGIECKHLKDEHAQLQ